MKILITGNMGYVGPAVCQELNSTRPKAFLAGFDMGYFGTCVTTPGALPECILDVQYFGDMRAFPVDILKEVDAIVHLAAISNDPMGNKFEKVTLEINHRASIELARKAKFQGVKAFVFASSCSMYGSADDRPKKEDDPLNPLTAYAKSKVYTERDLQPLADKDFKVTCLRFSTACGMSERLRLDLVLNDFVAGAFASKKITILSDGTPWRPLINVRDMARAIDWAIDRDLSDGGAFLAVNVGSDEWNYQVRQLAEAVASVIPGVEVSINPKAQPDKRSYRVNFELFKRLAPSHQPRVDLKATIQGLWDGLTALRFKDADFRNSHYMRLKVLDSLRDQGALDEDLCWRSKGGTARLNPANRA
jgi:nucleoside-diphosphate-sugar epimerase